MRPVYGWSRKTLLRPVKYARGGYAVQPLGYHARLRLNVNTDLDYFDNIIPCGISDKKVASMHIELGKPVPPEEVKAALKKHFAEVFGADLLDT